MSAISIIISGKDGQLGRELQDAAARLGFTNTHFFSRSELDITNETAVAKVFEEFKPAYFINTAAYTAVDKAETDQATAYAINATATGVIARTARQYNTKLIHISTDYVFNGQATEPYTEETATDPVNYYGYTKWLGEQIALTEQPASVVIRTSWVYSVYGNNFVKTMMRLMKERENLNVVADQFGSPTYAADLADAILQIISTGNFIPGIYHYSNDAHISWFDFAAAIQAYKKYNCNVHPIKTEQYPTPAKRPAYSVMSKQKIHDVLHIEIKPWKESLYKCLDLIE